MLESKDPAIKLFGKKIPFPAAENGDGEEDESAKKKIASQKERFAEQESAESPKEEEEKKNDENHQNSWQDSKSCGGDEDGDGDSKDQSESSKPQENNQQTGKPLKRPNKILPCPRCNSMDTKFCYYNNYNINQPRHFCKSCQRYWTAGGTMRNVPVGAGRRKNKNSSSHYRHITISEALHQAAARIDSATHPCLKTGGRVLSFGVEAQHAAPICESMASVLNLGDQKVLNGSRNGFHSFGDRRLMARIENRDDRSSGSTDEARTLNSRVPETHMTKRNNMNGFSCVPSYPRPYTWNPAVTQAGFFRPPGFPMPLYPYWSIPVLSPQSSSSSSSSSRKGSSSSGLVSSPLGKRSRDDEAAERDEAENSNGCVLVPKTLRMDDPNEAAKSSIWQTLGIKNEPRSKGGVFEGFDQKEKNSEAAETFPVLRANPAALSRSIDFHERS